MKLRVVGIVKSSAVAVDAGVLDLQRLHVHVGHLVVDFVNRLIELPAHTDVQRKSGIQFEVVLCEDAVPPLALPRSSGNSANLHILDSIEQKVSERVRRAGFRRGG